MSPKAKVWFIIFIDHHNFWPWMKPIFHFSFYQIEKPMLVTSDVDLIQQITIKQFSKFHSRRVRSSLPTEDTLARNALQWHHNERDDVSNHQPHDCLPNRLFRYRSKNTSKLRVTGLCEGNSPGTGEFPAQKASNAENVSIWWRHHGAHCSCVLCFVGNIEKMMHIWGLIIFCRGPYSKLI